MRRHGILELLELELVSRGTRLGAGFLQFEASKRTLPSNISVIEIDQGGEKRTATRIKGRNAVAAAKANYRNALRAKFFGF
jgi:hypothetical protein